MAIKVTSMHKLILFLFAFAVIHNCRKDNNDYRPSWIAPNGTICARLRQTEPGHQWTAYPTNGDDPKSFATKALAVAYIESNYCSTK